MIGLWPKSERTAREKFLCNLRALFIFLAVTSMLISPAIHSLIRVHGDLVLMLDNLQYTLPALAAMLRMVIFWWRVESLAPLIDVIADDWAKPKSTRETTMMISKAQTARTIISCGYGLMAVSLIVGILTPACGYPLRYITNVTDPGKPLPLQAHYIYDITESPQYELTFVCQALCAFLCVLPYTSIDNFLVLIVFHICGQLDILSYRIAYLDKFADVAGTLKSCVADHIRLFRAIIILEDTFNIILLLLFLYFATLFAFQGFLIIHLLEDRRHVSITRMVFLVANLVNVFGHMCIYCAVGDILTTQCYRIHYAAYANEWYNLNSRKAWNLVLLMARTSKPLHLTVGKVFPLTMATFCSLVKTSAGYISILLATRN